MRNINFYLQWLNLALVGSLLIISSSKILAAENTSREFSRQTSLIAQNQNNYTKVTFAKPPLGQGMPKGTKPGGSRGCPTRNPSTAIVPVTKYVDDTELRWGFTTQARPTVWYYVPYGSESINSAKLLLRDHTERKLYETSVTLTGAPGFVSISLPATSPALENHQWYQLELLLDLSCPIISVQATERVQAWVKRETLTPGLTKELERATPLQKAILYAKNGIWFEALTTVSELRRSNPQDPQRDYLLQSVGLAELTNNDRK
ncbi:DUF928 domain-containing protein [Cyanobacteria bacterium FACHB-63]|nr:DUF928 domain-containing protein [Cyanobacteria bacterium FACHB-63]